ncbi:hypothetical protein GALMADRAFT_256033 [Galerina marginata CBS 339.88]|uniref:BTB domain-containing protein n=1 Tax=Galerina marginata (strain CBS 339.88) TaxID=685588 RepID=A0A067SE10_GALM3|nr:hypothetical protein GALMADRAFT_256033 [Galerina marginata CBS 339.88]
MSQPNSVEPSSKRKRTDEVNDTKPGDMDTKVVRSTIWFSDGSIVLEAEETQFRVHKSVLSRNSSFFNAMFSTALQETRPRIEGCEVVRFDDAAEDWETVLEIVYDNVRAYKPTNAASLSRLWSMLRFGRKYEFEDLYKEAKERLKHCLPNSLDSWDKKYKELGPWLPYHPFDFANLLVEFGIKSLLPVAYYICLADHSLENIFRGAIAEDGTLIELMSAAKEALVFGREAFWQTISQTVKWTSSDNDGCLHPKICKAHRALFLPEIVQNWGRVMLTSPASWQNMYRPNSPSCTSCATMTRDQIQATRKEMWNILPTCFGLPAWDDLTDD